MTPLINSFVIAVVSTAVACLLGLLAALCIFALSPSRRFALSLLSLAVLPILVPNYVIVSFWMEALGNGGWLARIVADGRAVSLSGLCPTILVLSLIYWSPVALIAYFTLTKIDRAMVEAAELALGRWRARLRVVAPLLGPSVAIAGALVFVLTFSNFSVPATFLVKTIQTEIYVQFVASFDVAGAFLFALPQIVCAVALLAVIVGLLESRRWIAITARPSGSPIGGAVHPNGDRGCAERRTRRWGERLRQFYRQHFRIFRPQSLAFVFLLGLVSLSVLAPLFRAISAVGQWKILWQTLVVSSHQIWNSFLFASLGATIVIALAFAASPRRRVAVSPTRLFVIRHSSFVILLPFVLPEVLIGIALMAIFNRPSVQFIYGSIAIVLIALTARYFVVGKLAISTGQRHVDTSLLEAAELAGLPWQSRLLRIRLPLLAPWLFAGWWLTYLFCVADVGSLVLIYPPGADTVSIRIFNLLHYGYDAQVSALCLVMLAFAAAPVLLWLCMGWLRRRRVS